MSKNVKCDCLDEEDSSVASGLVHRDEFEIVFLQILHLLDEEIALAIGLPPLSLSAQALPPMFLSLLRAINLLLQSSAQVRLL